MKKIALTTLSVIALSMSSEAAVTLTISAVTGAANGILTNLQSSTGNATDARVWGILVDTTNNGITPTLYQGGFSLAGSSTTTMSLVGGAATDDVLYISPSLMANSTNATLDGGTISSTGLARPTTFASIPTPNGSVGQQFYVVWFDANVLGGTAANGSKYGSFRTADMLLPADGASVSFASNFVGADPARLASNTLVGIPEPSAALLGAIGALGLLRRRRN